MSNVQTFNDGSAAQVLAPLTPEQETTQALQNAMQILTRAKGLVITDTATYQMGDEMGGTIKNAKKIVEDMRVSRVKPHNTIVTQINSDAKRIQAPLDEALECLKKQMSAYQTMLAKQRAEAEAAAKAEQKRLEDEAKAKADAEIAEAKRLQAEADAARAAVDSDDPLAALLAADDLEEAERKAAEANEAAKQAIRETRVVMPALINAPKVTGSASRTFTVWEYEITDPALVPLAYRPIDTAAIARDVKVGKDECKIPGVRVFSRIEVR